MWFFGLDAMKCWVVLSALLGGFAPQIGAPLQGKSSREAMLSAVMGDLVIVLANKD